MHLKNISSKRLFFFVFAFLFFVGFFSFTPHARADIATGLVGHWEFENDAFDSSGQGNHGTAQGGPMYAVGTIGQAIDMDGVDDVVTRTDATLSGTFPGKVNSPYTAAAWVQIDTTTGVLAVLYKGGVRFQVNNGTPFCRHTDSAQRIIAADAPVGIGTWFHMACRYDGSQIRMFINGALQSQSQNSTSVLVDTSPLNIGQNNFNGSPFNGRIDDLRVYDRALTQADITQLYNWTGGGGGDVTPPVLSNGLPSGTLPMGTTQTSLQVTSSDTSTPVTCRYSTTPGQSYAAMPNTFSTTGGPNHSTMITGLQDGQSYTYYVRCIDSASSPNANVTDFPISFSVASAASFDYFLANSGDITVIQGNQGASTITANLTSGTTQSVSFSVSGLPTGASLIFSQSSCSPTCQTNLTITTQASTLAGIYPITVTGMGGATRTTNLTLTVNSSGGSCSTLYSGFERFYELESNPPDLTPIGPISYVPAYIGNGVQFGDNGELTCDYNAQGTGTCEDLRYTGGELAQGAWMRSTASGFEHENWYMAQAFTGEGMDMHIRSAGSGGQNRVIACYMNGIRRAQSQLLWGGQGYPQDGQLHHVSCHYTGVVNPFTGGEEVRLYIDGVEVTDSQVNTGSTAGWVQWPPNFPITGASANASGPFSIGSERAFQGIIDRAFRWNGPGYNPIEHYSCELAAAGGSPDTTPPTTPTLNAPSAISASQIDLSWSGSSDPKSGVSNYELYRCQGTACTPASLISSPTGTIFSNTGLVANTTYRYRVRAINGVGLPSSYSSIQSATTQSTPSPHCLDGIDNDGDLLTDFPDDPGCVSANDTDEFNLPSNKFQVNNRIEVSSGPLNVRSCASTSCSVLGVQATGDQGIVVGGSIFADGFWWWNINYDVNTDGWSVENWLEAVTPSPPPPSSNVRGYQSRACGFDLNNNNIIGELADCNVGDGVTMDPDGDGINEDIIYVNCQSGSDVTGNGTAVNPYRTIEYAFNQADGPGDGAEDIVAFAGICNLANDYTPPVGGVPGFYTKPRSGSEEWDFQFPSNPAMLIGWDTDNDGQYPPYDPDEIAILDNSGGNSRTFALNATAGVDNSYFEMSHFTVRRYGSGNVPGVGGFLKFNQTQPGRSHVYLHDLVLDGINRDGPAESSRIVFDWFHLSDMAYVAIVNINAIENGGYFNRGAGTSGPPDAGPLRWQNITYTAHGCDIGTCTSTNQSAAGTTIMKIWGYVDGFEVLDSVFDGNLAMWNPGLSGGASITAGTGGTQCATNITNRNNEFIDMRNVFIIQPYDATCSNSTRVMDNIIFDRNIVRWTGIDPIVAPAMIRYHGGASPNEFNTTGDITITNNITYAAPGQEIGYMVDLYAGNDGGPQTGTITIANNTMVGDNLVFPAIAIANPGSVFRAESFDIRNNVFHNLSGGDVNLSLAYIPSSLFVNNNVYDSDADYALGGTNYTSLSAWQVGTGLDSNSFECSPSFVNAAVNDYHLAFGDTCAQDRGVSLALVTQDIDGDTRPQGIGWDIGADEVTTGTSATPGDLNNDGSVNTLDWGIMNLQWFTSDPTADLNADGLVNSIDFGIMNSNWS